MRDADVCDVFTPHGRCRGHARTVPWNAAWHKFAVLQWPRGTGKRCSRSGSVDMSTVRELLRSDLPDAAPHAAHNTHLFHWRHGTVGFAGQRLQLVSQLQLRTSWPKPAAWSRCALRVDCGVEVVLTVVPRLLLVLPAPPDRSVSCADDRVSRAVLQHACMWPA